MLACRACGSRRQVATVEGQGRTIKKSSESEGQEVFESDVSKLAVPLEPEFLCSAEICIGRVHDAVEAFESGKSLSSFEQSQSR